MKRHLGEENKKKVLLGITGSIAAYKAADIVRRLQDSGYQVVVVMTKGAEKFITPLTLASLSGTKVYRKMFDKKTSSWTNCHIKLAQEASVFLIAPATANTIGKLAQGIADNLLLCTALATKAKIVIAPAMNVEMYHNEIVQHNLSLLKKRGAIIIAPKKGKLACGTVGEGHLADVEDIVKEVLRLER